MNRYKYIIIGSVLIFLLALSVLVVNAETLTFSWTANPEPTEGYRMYMDSGSNIVADNIPRETETYTITEDLNGDCHNFWLRAYDGDMESDNSDIAVACPVSEDPAIPIRPINVGGFTVAISVTPN